MYIENSETIMEFKYVEKLSQKMMRNKSIFVQFLLIEKT